MKKLYYLIVLALILGLVLTGCTLLSNIGQVPTSEQSGVSGMINSKGSSSYIDVILNNWGKGNFPEVWDLTQCDLTLSYTIDMSAIATAGWAVTEVGLREVGAPNIDPNLQGGWMQSNYIFSNSNPNSLNDNDIHLITNFGWGEQKYDASDPDTIITTPYWSNDNYGFWFDRDGVDAWQADMWGMNGIYDTGGIYEIVITYHSIGANTGTMFATINGVQQGLYIGGWKDAQPEFYPAGRSFTGDMTKMQVFYGRGGGGGTVTISDITVEGCFWAECEVDLIAGQYTDAGDVKVVSDGINLYVTYETTGDWEMTETHLYVGKTDPKELTSAPGQFPYSEEHNPAVSTFTYIIPIAEIDSYRIEKGKKWVADDDPGIGPGDQIYIAAHAKVLKPSGINILNNPDAETGDMSSWVFIGPVRAIVSRGESTGTVLPRTGGYFFDMTEYAAGSAKMSQVLNIEGYDGASFIANCWIQTELYPRGSTGTGIMENDYGELVLTFKDNLDVTLGTFTTGPIGNPVYGTGSGGYVQFDLAGNIPDEAVTVIYELRGTLVDGSYVNVFYDDLFFEGWQKETAWAKGNNFGTNWAMYFNYPCSEPE